MKKYREQKNQERTKLIHEAVLITRDLGEVVFLGAVAVFLHTRSGRESQDLDFVIVTPLTDEQLERKGYSKRREGQDEIRRTPNGYKIDIFQNEPINRIPISTIIETAVYLPAKRTKLKVVSLEVLILMKVRTAREQDREDIDVIVKERYHYIDWVKFKSLTESKTEYSSIHNAVDFIYNN